MDILITDFLSKIDFGEVQSFKILQIIPLFTAGEEGPVYLTLKEALEKRLLVITEVSAEASVPELKVINNAVFRCFCWMGKKWPVPNKTGY